MRKPVFHRDEDGNATINFVMVFPLLIALIFSIFEAGWLMTQNMMLERALDVTARDVRLGLDPDVSHDSLKTDMCAVARILRNCNRDLILEVVELDIDKDYPQNQANCIDRTGAIEPKITFNPAGRSRITFIRACMIVDPIVPGLGLGLLLPKDSSGGVQLVSYTAFMNEPI